MGEFGFGQSALKQPENLGKVLINETYFEESNINQKPLIWSKYKITTKFGQKYWAIVFFVNVHENCLKIKEK